MLERDQVMSVGDGFDKITSGIKNSLQIFIVLLLFGFIFSSAMQNWLSRRLDWLATHGVTSLKYGELEIKLQKTEQKLAITQQALQTVVNNPVAPAANPATPKPVPQDAAPASSVAPALSLIPQEGAFWAYVGQFQDGHFIRKPNFNVTVPPSIGQYLKASTDTYQRNDKPTQRGGEWFLGKITGVIKEGEQVRVRGIETVEGGNIWINGSGNSATSE
jgi:hypothetical protein